MPLNSQELDLIYSRIQALGASTAPSEERKEMAARLVNQIQQIDGIPQLDQAYIERCIDKHGWPPSDTLTTLLNAGYFDKQEKTNDRPEES